MEVGEAVAEPVAVVLDVGDDVEVAVELEVGDTAVLPVALTVADADAVAVDEPESVVVGDAVTLRLPVDEEEAVAILRNFLDTRFEGGRHATRVNKIEPETA